MRGSQSSATQVNDRRKTSKRAVILPQAVWEVQAIREMDEEKLSGEDGEGSLV
jgi:PHD/YefM family antitoxin component YafN of YafNO toxin-antitoxin module